MTPTSANVKPAMSLCTLRTPCGTARCTTSNSTTDSPAAPQIATRTATVVDCPDRKCARPLSIRPVFACRSLRHLRHAHREAVASGPDGRIAGDQSHTKAVSKIRPSPADDHRDAVANAQQERDMHQTP